jgi:hypothetical protein
MDRVTFNSDSTFKNHIHYSERRSSDSKTIEFFEIKQESIVSNSTFQRQASIPHNQETQGRFIEKIQDIKKEPSVYPLVTNSLASRSIKIETPVPIKIEYENESPVFVQDRNEFIDEVAVSEYLFASNPLLYNFRTILSKLAGINCLETVLIQKLYHDLYETSSQLEKIKDYKNAYLGYHIIIKYTHGHSTFPAIWIYKTQLKALTSLIELLHTLSAFNDSYQSQITANHNKLVKLESNRYSILYQLNTSLTKDINRLNAPLESFTNLLKLLNSTLCKSNRLEIWEDKGKSNYGYSCVYKKLIAFPDLINTLEGNAIYKKALEGLIRTEKNERQLAFYRSQLFLR